MLEFMRNKAAYIGLGIVIFFGATMFTGAFFFGNFSSDTDAPTTISQPNLFANVGQFPVDEGKFVEISNQYFSALNISPNVSIDPIVKEQVLWRAFLDTVNYTALIQSAEDYQLEVPESLMDASWKKLMDQSQITSKKELKKMLKERDIDYKSVENRLRKDSQAILMIDGIQSQVNISNKDVDDRWSQLKIDIIQIPKASETTSENADFIYDLLSQGMDFESTKATYSRAGMVRDKWVNYGELSLNIDKVIFNLEKGEISKPIKLPDATYIVKLIDRQNIPRSTDFDYESERESLLNLNRERATQAFLESFLTKNPIEIENPLIGAVYAKINMDEDAAIAAYQKQIQSNQLDPTPHYLLGRFYQLSNNAAEAKKQFLWAEIKLMDLPQYKFPFVTIGLIEYYSKHDPKKVASFKDRAIEHSIGNAVAIKKLKELADILNDSEFTKKVKAL